MLKRIIGTLIVVMVAGVILFNVSYNPADGIVERKNVLAAPLAESKNSHSIGDKQLCGRNDFRSRNVQYVSIRGIG